jgi:hypothetical protein
LPPAYDLSGAVNRFEAATPAGYLSIFEFGSEAICRRDKCFYALRFIAGHSEHLAKADVMFVPRSFFVRRRPVLGHSRGALESASVEFRDSDGTEWIQFFADGSISVQRKTDKSAE